jgi:hypothetical protein
MVLFQGIASTQRGQEGSGKKEQQKGTQGTKDTGKEKKSEEREQRKQRGNKERERNHCASQDCFSGKASRDPSGSGDVENFFYRSSSYLLSICFLLFLDARIFPHF